MLVQIKKIKSLSFFLILIFYSSSYSQETINKIAPVYKNSIGDFIKTNSLPSTQMNPLNESKSIILNKNIAALSEEQIIEKIENIREIRAYRFTPHISGEAFTQEPWSLSLQRSVGANVNTDLLLAALMLAVHERVEVGTVLAHYANKLHKGNISAKYNFWRSDKFYWSLGLSYAEFKQDTSKLEAPFKDSDIGIAVFATQLLLNYFPYWTNFKFGVNYNIIRTYLTEINKTNQNLSNEVKQEFGADISYPYTDFLDLTLGLGWLRDSGISAYEDVNFGFGTSLRWYRPKKLFSSPSFGVHYTPETDEFEFLLSSSIY